MKNFDGKTAVITGAGSGIGRELALQLAAQGCHLALSDINKEELEETCELASMRDTKVTTQVFDVSDKKAMQKHSEKVIKDHQSINIVINNAGVAMAGTVEETSIEDYEWLMGIDFWGVLYGTKFFLPHLQKVTEAHIVNISSVFGLIGVPTQSAYNAAKFAVRGFTESLKYELRDSHISVTCVHPGGIKTKIASSARYKSKVSDLDAKAAIEKFSQIAQTSPSDAAKTILQAIIKKEERVLIGPDAYAIDFIQRTFPGQYGMLYKLLQKIMNT